MSGNVRDLTKIPGLNWNNQTQEAGLIHDLPDNESSLFHIDAQNLDSKPKLSKQNSMSAPTETNSVNLNDINAVTQAFYDEPENSQACANLAASIKANPNEFIKLRPSNDSAKPELPHLNHIYKVTGMSSKSVLPDFHRLDYSNGDIYWGQTKQVPITRALFSYGKSLLPNQTARASDFQQVPSGVGVRLFVHSNIMMTGTFDEKGQLHGKGVVLHLRQEGGFLSTTFVHGEAGGPRLKDQNLKLPLGHPGTFYFGNGDRFEGRYLGGYGTCPKGKFTANTGHTARGRFFMGSLQNSPPPIYGYSNRFHNTSDGESGVTAAKQSRGALDGSLKIEDISPEIAKFVPRKGKLLYPKLQSCMRADGTMTIYGRDDKVIDILAHVEPGREAKLTPKTSDRRTYAKDMPIVNLGETSKKK